MRPGALGDDLAHDGQRRGVPPDRDLLLAWLAAFHRDIDEEGRDLEELVDEKLSYGGLTLWEVDGRPVSMAGATRPEAGMVRVLAVYTPAELRGRGYAGAVTSVVSRAARDAGALYQRLGYRPVEDRTVVLFQP